MPSAHATGQLYQRRKLHARNAETCERVGETVGATVGSSAAALSAWQYSIGANPVEHLAVFVDCKVVALQAFEHGVARRLSLALRTAIDRYLARY